MPKETKFVFVTGGVCSSLGKGVACASTACLLEARGISVALQKLDPYINVDPGTMSPYQHGEVYVTDDGAETDLDLGHYERFTHSKVLRMNSVSTGQVYQSVIERERQGGYLGKTVQMIPHITDEIKKRVALVAEHFKPDVQFVEIGGTVGDIEGYPFLEAIRQFHLDVGPGRSLFIHLTLVPHLGAADEYKTKPTQHSVGKLREIGIQPHILLCRCRDVLTRDMKEKIGLFCNVSAEDVVSARDINSTVYEIPLVYQREGLDELVVKKLGFRKKAPDLKPWKRIVNKIVNPKRGPVRIALVGKYVRLQDAYRSILDALVHGGIANDCKVEVSTVNAQDLEKPGGARILAKFDGILVPWGFDKRGSEGKIKAIAYARKKRIPMLGICLGMQCSVIEVARDALGLKGASSTEFDAKTPHPVITMMDEQREIVNKGGTMRLGAYPCELKPGTKAYAAYGEAKVSERHRHRWEFNPQYKDALREVGMIVSGTSPDGKLAEIVELEDHPWFIGCQFHPELTSRPWRPHPLFRGLVKAAMAHKDERPTTRSKSSARKAS